MNSHIDMIKMILHSLTRLTELDASIHTKQDVVTLDVTMDDLVFVEKFQSLQTLEKTRNKMFYLTTHSTHFIYGYMASDIW